VERGSDKHGPRQDEQLASEVEGLVRGGRSSHAEEWKEPEPSGEDQPDADLVPEGSLTGGTPAGLTATDVEGRSELAAFLGRSGWPATAAELADRASANDAPQRVLDQLRGLPGDRSYENVQEVWAALGGGVEAPRS
jgi:hypothetical protein